MSADPASYVLPDREVASSAIAAPVRDPARYEIIGEHGRGGLGRVSRAHDKDFGRDIAIKELLARGHVNEVRFAREAMITARLEHPGIVPVYETGRWPDGTPFYAMKLISGRSLRALIAERTTVDDRIGLLHHVIAVADTIAYAHGRNVIHRDLKPANVIVGEFGETVVIDWGLAKDLTESGDLPRGSGGSQPSDDGLTSAGSVLGTPTYMAPEQERGEAVDQRADVFAIGAMLWELCSLQKVPPTELAQRHRMLRKAGIDADLITIIDKALDPDAERRYPDAGALAADLKAFKSGARIAARDYSLWAMLAHWTRRHRALAISCMAVLAVAILGVAVFVRNIAVERDRADAALITAQRERDRAKLSEAALSIDRDPNYASELLDSFAKRTPRVALLASRARQRAAAFIVPVAGTVGSLEPASGGSVELGLRGGDRERLDLYTGIRTVLERARVDAYVGHADQIPLRPRTSIGGPDGDPQVVRLNDASYVRTAAGELFRRHGTAGELVDQGIYGIAGDGDLLLVCRNNGELEVRRHNRLVLRHRCTRSKTVNAMAVVGDDYAALSDDGTLVLSRAGRLLELPTGIQGEYELVLSGQRAIGIVDYTDNGRTWLIRADSDRLEEGPAYASQPWSVAASGSWLGWGYVDGSVILLDVLHGTRRELHGHPGPAGFLAIDADHARVAAASGHEVRIWDIRSPPVRQIATMPCASFHVQPSIDAAYVAIDCKDGRVRIWSRATNVISEVHQHVGYSFGVQWVRDLICSGGWGDGRVRCSNLAGTTHEVMETGNLIVAAMATTSDHESLFFGGEDGSVWRSGSPARELYAHREIVKGIAISRDGRLLASAAEDGSLVVFDLAANQQLAHRIAHAGQVCDVSWVGDELWSSGAEGTLKRWTIRNGELRLQHVVQMPGALRLLKVVRGGWAAVVGTNELLVSRDGVSVAMRLDAGKTISAIDVSSDQRYVAAVTGGEIIVVDLERSAIATLATDATVQQVTFLEPGLLAFSEPTALKTLQVDQLAYVPYEPAPELANRASF